MIVLAAPDGGVAVIHPAYDDLVFGVREGRTEADVLADVLAKHVPAGAEYRVVEETDLPYRGSFRNAWRRCPERGCQLDLDAAKAIKLDQIRRRRQPKLDELDRLYRRAVGQGKTDEAAAIEAQRQVLRDLPQTVVLPDDPAALDAYWPPEVA
ncbi:MAG TPA: hypothetical protein VF223_13050 [Trebonia sp.]